MMWVRARARGEEGLAMVVGLMVSFVVLMLSLVVVSQSIHSLNASGYDRQRLLSVNAAEAGVDYWWQYMQVTPAGSVDCGAKSATLGSGPNTTSFSANATFYGSDGTTEMACPFSDTTFPTYARIVSEGQIANSATTRHMESYIRLSPNYGGFGAAVLTVNSTNFSNDFSLNGQNGNDADIYVLNGNLTLSNQPNVAGNVYVPNGTATLSNNVDVKGALWANGTVTIDNPAKVEGNVLSSTGNLAGSGTIGGNASAAGTIAGGLSVAGTKTPGATLQAPPTQAFPQITGSTTAWVSAGYTVVDDTTYAGRPGATDCVKAYDWFRTVYPGSSLTNVVIRIPSTCTMANGNNDTNTIKGNVAFVSDGGFNLSQKSTWTAGTGIKKLYFISTYSSAACTGTKDVQTGNNTDFPPDKVEVFFYTPCSADMENQNAFNGQVMGGASPGSSVYIANNYNMSYRPVLVPGITGITGFKEDVQFVREIP
jgi:hypothetical protein